MSRSLLAAAVIVMIAAPAAHARISVPATADKTVNIDIRNFMFTPMTVTVPAGTRVTWTNRDDIPHTVIEKDKSFRSAALDTGESYARVFDQPGTYDYYCGLHPQMVAKVIVTAKAR